MCTIALCLVYCILGWRCGQWVGACSQAYSGSLKWCSSSSAQIAPFNWPPAPWTWANYSFSLSFHVCQHYFISLPLSFYLPLFLSLFTSLSLSLYLFPLSLHPSLPPSPFLHFASSSPLSLFPLQKAHSNSKPDVRLDRVIVVMKYTVTHTQKHFTVVL